MLLRSLCRSRVLSRPTSNLHSPTYLHHHHSLTVARRRYYSPPGQVLDLIASICQHLRDWNRGARATRRANCYSQSATARELRVELLTCSALTLENRQYTHRIPPSYTRTHPSNRPPKWPAHARHSLSPFHRTSNSTTTRASCRRRQTSTMSSSQR